LTKDFPYRKIPGSRQGLLLGASMWLGDNHILAVKNQRFSEEYRRYYLNDIQALVMRATPKFAFSVYVVLGLAVSVIAAFIVTFTRFARFYNDILVVIFLFLVYMAWIAFFRSCECHIVTAVGLDELPALHRIDAAKKAFALIAERVREVQGELPGDWEMQMGGVASAPAVAVEPDNPAPAKPANVIFSWLTVAFLFADAVLTLSLQGHPVRAWSLVDRGVYLALIVCAVAAIVQIRRRAATALRATVIATVVFAGLVLYAQVMVPAFVGAFSAARSGNASRAIADSTRVPKVVENVSITGDILMGGILAAVLLSTRPKGGSA
jgi:hypothetical protein